VRSCMAKGGNSGEALLLSSVMSDHSAARVRGLGWG